MYRTALIASSPAEHSESTSDKVPLVTFAVLLGGPPRAALRRPGVTDAEPSQAFPSGHGFVRAELDPAGALARRSRASHGARHDGSVAAAPGSHRGRRADPLRVVSAERNAVHRKRHGG